MIDSLYQLNVVNDEENLSEEEIIKKFGKGVIVIDFNQLDDTGVILFQSMIEKELSRINDIIYKNTIDTLLIESFSEDECIQFDSHNITVVSAMKIIDYVIYVTLLNFYFNNLFLFEHSDETTRKYIKNEKIIIDPAVIGSSQMYYIKSMLIREINHIKKEIQSMKIDNKEELSEDENEIAENFVSFISKINNNIKL